MTTLSQVELAKQAAAHSAVQDYIVNDNMIIGIGSGSTIIYAVEKIAEICKTNKWLNMKFIPTSFQSQQLIIKYDLPLGNLIENYKIDVVIDGADEVDKDLNCIKGGGGCHLNEKMVAVNAKKFVIIADFRKQSNCLCTCWKKGIPVSFLPQSRMYLQSIIENHPLNGKCVLRMATMKAGPVITDEGHMIFDVDFGEAIDKKRIIEIDHYLHMIPGVIETGFFIGMCDCAYFGQKDGSVIKMENSNIGMGKLNTISNNSSKI